MNLIVVTGASQNHFNSLLQFLKSTIGKPIHQIYVYDLGLTPESIVKLCVQFPYILLRTFDYTAYPSYFNIHQNAGEYAWKPIIIYEVMNLIGNTDIPTSLLWCDAGNILGKNISLYDACIQTNHLYSPISSGTIKQWTHPSTIEWFNMTILDPLFYRTPRNGAIMGFHINHPAVRTFINEFARCAQIKECIAPEGSNRTNHRQDQSVFTIMYYRFFEEYKEYHIVDDYLGMKIHCDID